MLNSLNVVNYRNLRNLRINSLGKINLITGKNNTGKSTILEAIAIFAAKGDFSLIYQLLADRGEYYRQTEVTKNFTDYNIKTITSLFTDRVIGFESDKYISIGSVENTLFGDDQSSEDTVTLRLVKYFDDIQKDNQGNANRKRTILDDSAEKNGVNFKVGFESKTKQSSNIISLDEDRPFRFGFRGFSINENFQFIKTGSIDREMNGKLWDSITLTDKEQYVIEALKIIEPTTERIAFVDENSRERVAKIKLSNTLNVLPLRSMGDGINRILTIILALVNSDNGFLLIDEFENGLHYSVQQQLWDVIFELSQKLNVQVFITTHSNDCIKGFENALNKRNNSALGKLIRLDSINGVVQQVLYDAVELNIAIENNIETR